MSKIEYLKTLKLAYSPTLSPYSAGIIDYWDPVKKLSCYGGKTLEQLKKNYPDIQIISQDEGIQKEKEYHESKCEQWKEINVERYWYNLEVLPPQRRVTIASGISIFYCMEALTGDIHLFTLQDRNTGKFYEAHRNKKDSDKKILQDYRDFLKGQK